MLSDGGCIKDVQIRLLLSSRNEMQKVIETARQQSMQLTHVYMQQMQQPQLPIVVGSWPPLTAKVYHIIKLTGLSQFLVKQLFPSPPRLRLGRGYRLPGPVPVNGLTALPRHEPSKCDSPLILLCRPALFIFY